jgi:hypothetical protein
MDERTTLSLFAGLIGGLIGIIFVLDALTFPPL